MDRGLTAQAAVIQWLLDHAAMTDVTAYLAQSPGELRAIGGCKCGCTSLDFQDDWHGSKIIAEAVALYPDGQRAGLILWAATARSCPWKCTTSTLGRRTASPASPISAHGKNSAA